MSTVAPDAENFRLLSISTTSTPSGCVGADWFVYKIAQGENIITGYRRGDLQSVSAEVATIVVGLNGRRGFVKSKPGPKPGRRKEATASAPSAAPDEDHA